MVSKLLEWTRFALVGLATLVVVGVDGSSVAHAQTPSPGVDLHGQLPSVSQGTGGEPVLLWAPPALQSGWWLGAQAEYGNRLLAVDYKPAPSDPWQLNSVVPHIAGLDLSARWTLARRFGIALTAPLFVAKFEQLDIPSLALPQNKGWQLVLPDARLALPIGIIGGSDGYGPGLGVIPFVTVPTGVGRPLLSSGEPSFGGLLAVGLRKSPVSIVSNLGAARVPTETGTGLPTLGPIVGLASFATGWKSGPLWTNLELKTTFSLSPSATSGGIPRKLPSRPSAELFLSTGGRFGRVNTSLGGGTHLTESPGAAAFRGIASFGVAGGALARSFAPPREMIFRVYDPRGFPKGSAAIILDGVEVGRTGGGGELSLPAVSRWKTYAVEAENFVRLEGTRPPDLTYPFTLTLAWKPAVLDAVVTDADGNPVEVILTASQILPDGTLAPPLSPAKPGELELSPGTYRVQIDAEGQATQYREVVVPEDGAPPAVIQAVSVEDKGGASLSLRILQPEGGPVVGARVLVDGVPVGTTADGGLIQVTGFADGPHRVEIQHETFTSEVMDLVLSKDRTEIPTTLQRVPGTVRVSVVGPDDAPVRDAVIRYIGESRLAPMAVGPTGERIDVLSPGDWVLIVSSTDYGIQERDITIPADRYELLDVRVKLRPIEDGTAELELHVADPGGVPVEGLSVSIGEEAIGTTSTGGNVRLTSLAPGPRTVHISGADLAEAVDVPVFLNAGINTQLATIRFKPGTVDTIVRGPDGVVSDALVRFIGPQELPPELIGSTGRRRTVLGAGAWTAVVTSPQYGIQERDFVIDADSGERTVLEFVLRPVEDGIVSLVVRVIDGEGVPVEGAEVALDGESYGTTSNSGVIRIQSLDVGSRELSVAALGREEYRERHQLIEGEEEIEVALDWRLGAVKVRVKSQGEPVSDAVVRLFGPMTTPPAQVDPRGEWLGTIDQTNELWMVVVTSPSVGIAEQDLIMRPSGLTVVDVDMKPPSPERTDLLVSVIDEVGLAVDHAQIFVNGALIEQTEQGGTLLARALQPGPAKLKITAPDFVDREMDIELRPGMSESYAVRLAWATVDTTVETRGPDGLPIDARVQWRDGPSDVTPRQSGVKGIVTVPLRPGRWHVYATSGQLAAEGSLDLAIGDTPKPIVLALSPSGARMVGDEVTIDEMVQFDFGQATLRPDSEVILTEVARVIKSHPSLVRILIEGHTDNIGSITLNQSLSAARAEAVRQSLIERGVAPEVLVARGFASTRPIAENDSEEGRTKNRRVQFVVTERGAAMPQDPMEER